MAKRQKRKSMKITSDTNIISDYLNDKKSIIQFINTSKPENLYITTITILESLGGWQIALSKVKEAERAARIHQKIHLTTRLLGHFPILEYSEEAMEIFEELKNRKLNVASNDLRIAAIALANNMPLATQNRRDFERIEGLVLYDWE
jgi:tRNA(fMet)-specific endonuclease VapC